MLHDFQLSHPTTVYFGTSKEGPFLDALAAEKAKWLLVTGGESVDRTGIFEQVSQALDRKNISFVRFKGIEPNPDVSTIGKAVAFGSSESCSGVLALGGGSVMDASKAIAAGLSLGEPEMWPVVTAQKRLPTGFKTIPLFCIPTTAGTASEVTPYAVISNRFLRDKQTFFHEALYPRRSWLNPSFTIHVPQKVTAETSADIFSHVLENYVLGGDGSPLADAYSEAVMKTVFRQLPIVWEEPANLEARAQLMLASNWALNGFQGIGRRPGPFILHAIEHVMSAWKPELAHGGGLATLFPAYFHWLLESRRAVDRLCRLSTVLFGLTGTEYDARIMVVELHKWLHRFGIGCSMEELGFKKEDYKEMAAQVFKQFKRDEIDLLGPFKTQNVVEIFELTRFQKLNA